METKLNKKYLYIIKHPTIEVKTGEIFAQSKKRAYKVCKQFLRWRGVEDSELKRFIKVMRYE